MEVMVPRASKSVLSAIAPARAREISSGGVVGVIAPYASKSILTVIGPTRAREIASGGIVGVMVNVPQKVC